MSGPVSAGAVLAALLLLSASGHAQTRAATLRDQPAPHATAQNAPTPASREPAQPHGGFGGAAPEALELQAEIARFVQLRWAKGSVQRQLPLTPDAEGEMNPRQKNCEADHG
ncbi:hypothetical protein [Bradyrhizobium sp. LeoA1S1]